MAQFTGQNMCDEIAFRISNRLPANGTGAGSILQYLNLMYLLIDSSASWRWSLQGGGGANALMPDALGHIPANTFSQMNPGKKVSVFNSSDKSPVMLVDQDSYPASSQGYAGTIATVYNTFRVSVALFGGNNLGELWLYPVLASPVAVDVYYHQIPYAIVSSAYVATNWPYSEMDDLLMDWTEAKIKRVLGMAGWDALWADCLGRLGEMRKIYTTERENIGPQDEATGERDEKNKVGRA
jgi:hypothetical protein